MFPLSGLRAGIGFARENDVRSFNPWQRKNLRLPSEISIGALPHGLSVFPTQRRNAS